MSNPLRGWKEEIPVILGWYWFYGWDFGITKLNKGDKPRLHTVKVRETSNGFAYICDGHFIFPSADGVWLWLESPCLPDYAWENNMRKSHGYDKSS